MGDLRTPMMLDIALTTKLRGGYIAVVKAWGVPEHGPFTSLWRRELTLGVPRTASAAEVLAALAEALSSKVG